MMYDVLILAFMPSSTIRVLASSTGGLGKQNGYNVFKTVIGLHPAARIAEICTALVGHTKIDSIVTDSQILLTTRVLRLVEELDSSDVRFTQLPCEPSHEPSVTSASLPPPKTLLRSLALFPDVDILSSR